MVRSISNNDDCQRSQINLFGPAKDFSKIEIRAEVVTTLNVGAGEGARASARTLLEPGRNCRARRMERDTVHRKISRAKVVRRGDRVPPSLRREATSVVLSQKTATVRPCREDWNWRRPSWTASSSLAYMDNAAWWASHRPEAI